MSEVEAQEAENAVAEPNAEVRGMIDYAMANEFNKANDVFGDMMTIKLNDLLDQEQVKLADAIYNGAEDDENDEDIEDAKSHFEDELGLSDEEAKERMAKMGYDEKLPEDKVRLIETSKKFIEEYIESILKKKTKSDDLVKNDQNEIDEKKINPILMRQLKSLKSSLKDNDLTVKDILDYLNDNE